MDTFWIAAFVVGVLAALTLAATAWPPRRAVVSADVDDAVTGGHRGARAATSMSATDIGALVIVALVILAALFVLISGQYGEGTEKWASGALGAGFTGALSHLKLGGAKT